MALDGAPAIPGLRFTALLGRGGMASVYAAVQTSLDREVAVKVVQARDERDLAHLQRLENEARALAGLQHPNIVELYDFGRTADGGMYYVMPLLPGGDLRRWVPPVDEDRVAELLDAVLTALGHAHAAGIVHRDIKPENILFDRNARPLLADFGAALRRDRSRLTDEGMAIGSAGYMSPEQARGAEVDARSDLYGVAVLGWELLTGELPFDGPDALAIALAQFEQPVPRLPPRLAHWQAFFDRGLAYEPAWRFDSAAAMQAALQAVDAELVEPPPSRWRQPRTLGLGLALLASVMLGSLLWLSRAVPPDAAAVAALIEQGALLPPREPNALDALLQARREGLDPAQLTAQAQRLLAALIAEQQAPLAAGDLAALLPLWQRWQAAVGALDAHAEAMVVSHNAAVEAALLPPLQAALQRFDRREAALALPFVDASAMATKTLLELASRVRELPLEGERFADPGGPPLVLIERPEGTRPGLALMAGAVDRRLFAEFAAATGRQVPSCRQGDASVQGCLDLPTAQALADWLSARSGHSYRLPRRNELAGAAAQLEHAELFAWTADCRIEREVRDPNIAQRAWGGIRRVFGGEPARPRVDRRCGGQWAISLDGSVAAKVLAPRDPAGTAVLARELAPPAP
jgi:serine/threonine-protein kinase PpkA